MKFWELVYAFRDAPSALERVVETARWHPYRAWLIDYDEIVKKQRREVLDAEVPDSLCLEALASFGRKFEIRNGHLTWVAAKEAGPQTLTATEVYQRYGGSAIAEVLEFGSLDVSTPNKR